MPLDKMNPDHQERFKLVLIAQATLHMKDPNKELDKPRLQLYWRSLQEYDIEHIETAGRILIDESDFFPKPRNFHAVLRKIAHERPPTTLPPTDGIWCEYCDDLGLAFYWHGPHGEIADGRITRFLEYRDYELRQRPPATAHGMVQRQEPRWRARVCSCRNSNPNYQARQKGREVPAPSSIDDGDTDPNQWSHEESSRALARYTPGKQQKGMDW